MSHRSANALVEAELVGEAVALYVVRPEDFGRSYRGLVCDPGESLGAFGRRRGRWEREEYIQIAVGHCGLKRRTNTTDERWLGCEGISIPACQAGMASYASGALV